MLTLDSLIAQVRRRRITRAVLLYGLFTWFVVQFTYHVLPMVNLPAWIAGVLLVIAIIAFPFVVRRAAAAPPVPPKPPGPPLS